MIRHPLRRWTIVLLLGLAWGTAAGAEIDTRCIADGGPALCNEPIVVPSTGSTAYDSEMWTYNVCDMDGSFPWREAAWCQARGGCGNPVFDPDIAPVSSTFERIVNDACSVNLADSGWGQTIPQNILCWYGAPLSQNGKLIRDFRRLDFNGTKTPGAGCTGKWTDVVYAGRWRAQKCPETYAARTRPNGDLECWKLPPDCPDARNGPLNSGWVGNPILLLDGCKSQREIDYRSRTPGGLAVERFYNSGGHFRFDAAPVRSTDVWRTTWDRRIVAAPGSGNVLAYAQRADGSLKAFLPNGREMHNNGGGASALLQRTTDASGATTAWRLTTADNDVERYDAAGRLQSATLRAGWTYTLAYDANGRLETVTDTFGNVLTFTYDSAGRPGGFVAPGNRSHVYGYDAKGRLAAVTHPDGAVRTYHYENATFLHALTGITDENNHRFATWTYDSTGRATTSQHAGGAEAVTLYYRTYSATANEGSTDVVDAFGAKRSYYYQVTGGVMRIKRITQPCPACNDVNAFYTFDGNGNVATHTDFRGNQTIYTHDLARNLEVARTEAYGTAIARTITTQWHPLHRLPTRISAPSGVNGGSEVTDFLYDAQGNVLQKTITAGGKSRQWNMTYNSLGQVLAIDGPRTDVTDVTTYTYHGVAIPCTGCRGNVRTVTNALGHVTTFDAYDMDGQPTRIIDPNGVVTTLAYDVRGRLRTRTVNAGSAGAETTMFDYDNVGQLVGVTAPDGSVLRYQYDAAHRLTEVADGIGNVIQYTLDAMGNRIREEVFDPADRLVRTQRRIYDALNRLYNDIGATGQLSVYLYDGNGNPKTRTDPLNRNTMLAYDALNRLSTATDPAGGASQYGYDAKDHLVTVRDPLNLTTTYTYDGLGNLAQLASPDTGISTYTADAAGNVVGSTDARGVASSYAYDALDRQTLTSFGGGSVALEYDNAATGGAYAKGRLTRLTDPSGTTAYAYDAWGRVIGKTQTAGTDAATRTLTIGYQHAAGRATGITYPSGRSVSYAFDAQGRISGIAIAGQTILGSVEYFPYGGVQGWTWANGQAYRRAFDADGRIASLTLGPDSPTYGSENWMFGYDGLDRLVTAALPQGEALAYTYDGNGNRRQETRSGAVTSYAYASASNRLQGSTGAMARAYGYDAAGNVTGNGSATFTYDGRGRLTQVSGGYRYAINGLGQRVAKTGPGVATAITYYGYDEQGHLLGEYDAAGAVRQEIVYLADTPVASVRPAIGGGVDIYPIYSDHLDAPRLITNQGNQKVWEWKTDTFGTGAANENPGGLGIFSFNLRFPGQYYDAETGLHYNYFRDYDPSVGRYVESDPIGLVGGINTYAYVGNNPLIFNDALGLATYQCTRRLNNVPFRAGPLFHQYVCAGNSYSGFTCGGLGPTGSMFDSPGRLEPDRFVARHCEMVQEDNACIENCIRQQFQNPFPKYSINLQYGDNCQTYATGIVVDCVNRCKLKGR